MTRTRRAHRRVSPYIATGVCRSASSLQSEIRSSELAPLRYETAIRGDEIFIAGNNLSGTRVYRPGLSDSWEEFDKLQPLDSHIGGGVTSVIRKNYLFIMQRNWNAERQAYVINVFRNSADAPFEHVATLVSSDGGSLANFAISSRRVMADCGNEACYFALPASFISRIPSSIRSPGRPHGMVDERGQRLLDC